MSPPAVQKVLPNPFRVNPFHVTPETTNSSNLTSKSVHERLGVRSPPKKSNLSVYYKEPDCVQNFDNLPVPDNYIPQNTAVICDVFNTLPEPLPM